MRLVELEPTSTRTGFRVRGVVERESRERVEVYFDYHGVDTSFACGAAEAFAAALLVPCMRAGEALHVDRPLSPLLCFNLPRIRDIHHAWWPDFARIEIRTTPGAVATGVAPQRAATFFSGGVDSFYSLLKHRSGAGTLPVPLTHIIFMRGIETRLYHARGLAESERWVQETAAATGVQCIVGESNLRSTVQSRETKILWQEHYHGSALAAAALALSSTFAYVCIPSSWSYNHLVAHGSTPLVDEMYSTERLRIVHDGGEASRAVKVARLLEWDRDVVLRYLRVCHYNRGGAFNCGKCAKCVRTAVALYVLGAWHDAHTFPSKTIDHWEETIAADHLPLIEENLHLARDYGADGRIVRMLERVVRRARRKQAAIALASNSPFAPLLPVVRRVKSRVLR